LWWGHKAVKRAKSEVEKMKAEGLGFFAHLALFSIPRRSGLEITAGLHEPLLFHPPAFVMYHEPSFGYHFPSQFTGRKVTERASCGGTIRCCLIRLTPPSPCEKRFSS
jgi:hypothetical protein